MWKIHEPGFRVKVKLGAPVRAVNFSFSRLIKSSLNFLNMNKSGLIHRYTAGTMNGIHSLRIKWRKNRILNAAGSRNHKARFFNSLLRLLLCVPGSKDNVDNHNQHGYEYVLTLFFHSGRRGIYCSQLRNIRATQRFRWRHFRYIYSWALTSAMTSSPTGMLYNEITTSIFEAGGSPEAASTWWRSRPFGKELTSSFVVQGPPFRFWWEFRTPRGS